YVTNKLIELVIHFQRFANKKECKMKSNQEIELDHRYKIFKYLDSHLSEKLTLSKLSGFFYMSESAISKYIYDVTGLSFTALLNE
ncbi:AraC family transcriptional regulator, partial [Erysipelothrix rhusiopathiae]|nr:AraC family transcriptional regulator [Erysipelothrix rhusiopathiae]